MNLRAVPGGAGSARRPRLTLAILAAALLSVLTACVPSANVMSVPTFSLDAGRSGFVRIDPPGIGAGTALFRLVLDVNNPNVIPVKLAGLDGALFVKGTRAATATFRGGLDVPAGGSAPLILDVNVPLGAAPALLEAIATYVGGAPTSYRLDAAVTVDVFGAPQRFPEFTLVTGELPAPNLLQAPLVELAGSSLRFESLNSVAVNVGIKLTNMGRLGFRVAAPDLTLSVAGASAASAGLSAVELPAGGSAEVNLTFRFDPLALGAAVAAQVQAASAGAAGLAVTLSGGLSLEAPGVATLALQPMGLLEAVLR